MLMMGCNSVMEEILTFIVFLEDTVTNLAI